MITHTLNSKAKYFIVAENIKPHGGIERYSDDTNLVEKLTKLHGGDIFIDKYPDIFIYLGNRASYERDKNIYNLPNKVVILKNKFYELDNNYSSSAYFNDIYGDRYDIMNMWHECFLFVDERGKEKLTKIRKINHLLKNGR